MAPKCKVTFTQGNSQGNYELKRMATINETLLQQQMLLVGVVVKVFDDLYHGCLIVWATRRLSCRRVGVS